VLKSLKNALLLALLLLAGCTAKYANTPTATNFPTTEQQVLQAAHHWDVIGNRVTQNVVNAIKGKVAKNERILIKPEQSDFGKQLYMNLAKELTSNGFRVITNHSNTHYKLKEHDVLIEPKVQLVNFSKGRSQPRQIGMPSAIVTGLWALESIHETTALGVATAGVFSYDVWEWFNSNLAGGSTPKTEIMVDVITTRKDEYLAINKDTYYVVESDAELYKALEEPLMTDFKVIGENK
jgi:hypothetical protein